MHNLTLLLRKDALKNKISIFLCITLLFFYKIMLTKIKSVYVYNLTLLLQNNAHKNKISIYV